MLNKNQILSANDLTTKTVSVPEWGGEVMIRELTGRQRDILEGLFASRINPKTGAVLSTKDLRAKMVIMSVIGEDGEYIFADKDTEDVSGKSARALDRIVDAVQAMNGLNETDVEEKAGN